MLTEVSSLSPESNGKLRKSFVGFFCFFVFFLRALFFNEKFQSENWRK